MCQLFLEKCQFKGTKKPVLTNSIASKQKYGHGEHSCNHAASQTSQLGAERKKEKKNKTKTTSISKVFS